jgi:hypothetical protein
MSRFSLALALAATLFLAPVAESAPLFHASSIHYSTHGPFERGSALGDFDGDGHLDYAVVVEVPSLAVLTGRGHGDGTFDPAATLLVTPFGAPKAADLNGDGFADLAVSGPGGLAIRYGSPAGLGAPVYLTGVDQGAFMDVADLDGDGRLDLVTGQGTDVVVRLATGPTTYAPGLASPTGLANPVDAVTMGDIDEDGRLDVLLRSGDVVFWMKGHGDGTFDVASAPIGTTLGYPIFLSDLNGDHHLDVVDYDGWSLGDGQGHFGSQVAFASPIIGVGEVTGDGAPELICDATQNPSLYDYLSLAVYRNDGAGNFVRTWSRPDLSPNSPSFGDVNGDGVVDVVVPDDAIGTVSVQLSNGDGTFGAKHDYATGNGPSGVVLADITGDGRLDAVTSNQGDGTISVLPGLPGGQFGAPITYAVGSGPNGIATGDLNGDGRPDIVTANGGSNTVSVLLGQPGGGLGSAVSFPVGANPVSVAIGDIDRDGHLDVVVADNGSRNIALLRGDGAGGLTIVSTYADPNFPPWRVVIGDVDGDAWPDVVVGTQKFDRSTGGVDVFRGNGAGGLLSAASYGGGGRDVAIHDVTGDGIPDVLTLFGGTVGIFPGTGGGGLGPITTIKGSSQDNALLVVDGDADGKPDFLIAAEYANCVWFHHGLGAGAFGPPEGYGTERSPGGLAVADLDGDGTLDVVTSDSDTSLVTVLLGVAPGPVPALATLVSAEATRGSVRIEWLAGSTGMPASVDRSENGNGWVRVGMISPDGSGRLTFEDPNVSPGADYIYRLGFDRAGETVYAGLVSVHVPLSASLSLAPGSNPALGSFNVSFSLPDARPARLELYDVSGRRVLAREVGAMGAGTHVIRLGETSQLASGVYWLRLVHPTKTLVARAALLR